MADLPRIHPHLRHPSIPEPDQVALTRIADLLGLPDEFTAMGGVLKTLTPLLGAASDPLPLRVAGRWRELNALCRHAPVLHDWVGVGITEFDDELGRYPLASALAQRLETPCREQARLLKQVLLAALLVQEAQPQSSALAPAADQVRLACKLVSSRVKTLEALPDSRFSADAIDALHAKARELLKPRTSGYDRPLLRKVRSLCQALETPVSFAPEPLPLPLPAAREEGMPRLIEIRPSADASWEEAQIAEPVQALVTEAGGPGEDVSRAQQRALEVAATYALAEAANWLPWKKMSLDPVERRALSACLETLEQRSEDLLDRFFFGLVAATGLLVADLLALPFGPGAVLTPDGRLLKRAPLPAEAFRPREEHGGHYHDTHVDAFYLTLPPPIRALLVQVITHPDGTTLGEALGIESEAAPDITDTLSGMLKTIAGPRLTVRHLARALRDEVLATSRDAIETALITGPVDGHLPVTSAYLASDVRRLSGVYSSASAALFGSPSDRMGAEDVIPATLGSRCTPDWGKLKEDVRSFGASTARIVGDATRTLAERHNAYTLYTAELIRATGLRPVTDFAAFTRSFGRTHAIAEDKAPTERHACRPLILPPTVREQLDHYRDHLASLARELLRDTATEAMGAAIVTMLREPYHEGMLPFLFLLNEDCTEATSLSPKALRASRPEWPYPENVGRHLMATGLTEQSTPAHLRQLQLGHLSAGEVHLGDSSLLALKDSVAALEGPLEHLTIAQGWVAMRGPFVPRPLPVIPKGIKPYLHATLGPVGRARSRNAKRATARRALKALLRAMPRTPHATQPVFDTVRAELIRQTGDDADVREWAERLWWRFSRRRQDRHNPLIPPWHFSCYAAAYPTFWREQPFYSDLARRARTRFEMVLSERSRMKERPSPARRAAEVLTSAALYGMFFAQAGLDRLRVLDVDDHVEVAGLVMLESTDEDGVTTRWAADRLTGALIDRKGTKGPAPTKREVFKELRALLGVIAPDVDAKDPLRALSDLGRAFWRTEAPGVLWSYADGALPSAPLRPGTLKRVLADRRLKTKLEDAILTERAPSATPPLGRPRSLAETREVYRELCRIIRDIRRRRAEGHIHSRCAERRAFQAKVAEVFGDRRAALPSVAAALVGWAEHLACAGTDARPRLALSSILRYISALTGLVDAAYDHDLAILSGDGFGELYSSVLDAAAPEGRPYIANRIVEFHRYLSWISPVGDPDWSFLPKSAARRVDANLISDREYRRCLKLLFTDPYSTVADRLQQAALLVLGFRFGLRAGECCRLRDADLTLEIERGYVVVDVDNNFYGRTKSLAGRRRVPLIGVLDPMEQEILQGLKEAFAGRLKRRDPLAGLFADPDDPRAEITCQKLFQRIHEALALVTGDRTLRFHHLRHSFGTRLFLGLVGDKFASDAVAALTQALFGHLPDHEVLRTYLTRDAECGPMTLEVVPSLLGHAALETSIGSYVHVMEFLVAAECDRYLGDVPISAWAYALGDKTESVRVRIRRRRRTARGASVPHIYPPRWPRQIPGAKVLVARGRPPHALSPRSIRPVRIDLPTVNEVLNLLKTRDGDTFSVARSLQLPEDAVVRILDAAREHEEMGGRTGVSVRAARGFFAEDRSGAEIPSSLLRAQRRLEKGLKDWDAALRDADPEMTAKMWRGLRVRFNAAKVVEGRWVFDHADGVMAFLDVLHSLGIKSHVLNARLEGAAGSEECHARHLETLQALGFRRVSRVETGPARVSVTLVRGSNEFVSQATLDRALEILWIKLRAEARRDDYSIPSASRCEDEVSSALGRAAVSRRDYERGPVLALPSLRPLPDMPP